MDSRTMINNTWAWATAKGLVYKHPINQAEYVDLDVDSMKSTTKLTKSDIRLQAAATVKDPTNIYIKRSCSFQFNLHTCICILTYSPYT